MNRDKAFFGAVEDQCNDSIGLQMMALAYLVHDTSNTVMCDPPLGKEEPVRQWYWDAERGVKYYMSNMSRRRILSIRTGYPILNRVVTQESARVHTTRQCRLG
jgi:hypothetical protein